MKTETFDYEIRLATTADIDAIVDTALIFWHSSNHAVNRSQNPVKFKQLMREYMGRSCTRIIIAVREGKVIGYIMIYAEADYKDALDGELYQFFVHPDYRGSGVGRDLVEMAVQVYDDWGCDVCYAIGSAEVGENELVHFRNLFAKFGFVETGIVMTRRKIHGST